MKKIALMVAVATLAVMPAASANHSWNGFHWARSANPANLTVVDSVVGVWDGILPSVNGEWSASPVLNLNAQGGGTGLVARLLCNAQAGKIHACSANYGPTGWFGITTVRTSDGSHISSATVQLNDFYFTGSFANNVARHHVACQEVGHALGLDHVGGVSCMNDNNAQLNNPAPQGPSGHDYDQLAASYAHLDGGGKAAPASKSAGPDLIQRIGGEWVLTYIFYA